MNDDLNFGINIVVSETIREIDGLAMSSRNTYLSPENRAKAVTIFHSMEAAKKIIKEGESGRKIINSVLLESLNSVPELKVDYASAVLADTLEEPDTFNSGDEIVILIAVHLGKTRLIDNSIVKIP